MRRTWKREWGRRRSRRSRESGAGVVGRERGALLTCATMDWKHAVTMEAARKNTSRL